MSVNLKNYDNVRMKNYTVTLNLNGKDYYVVPKDQYTDGFATTLVVINGDYRSGPLPIKEIAFDGGNLMIIFTAAMNKYVHINYTVIEQV